MSIKDTITKANREEELKKNPILALFDVVHGLGDMKEMLQSIFDRKVEPPVVNVEAPVVNIPAPIVNVPAPIVNIPEQVAPIVNVPAPVVNIEAPIINVPEQPAPIVNVNTEKFEEGIDTTNKTLKDIFEDLKARGLDIGKVQLVDKDGKPIDLTKIYSSQGAIGGRGYETVWVKNVAGTKQNPATEETSADKLLDYKLSDIDDASDPVYLGYLRKDGAWYIQKITTNTAVRYIKGASGYNFANRASETYNTFDVVF